VVHPPLAYRLVALDGPVVPFSATDGATTELARCGEHSTAGVVRVR
jgi:hypothetical protein